jgi:hypothetical protein
VACSWESASKPHWRTQPDWQDPSLAASWQVCAAGQGGRGGRAEPDGLGTRAGLAGGSWASRASRWAPGLGTTASVSACPGNCPWGTMRRGGWLREVFGFCCLGRLRYRPESKRPVIEWRLGHGREGLRARHPSGPAAARTGDTRGLGSCGRLALLFRGPREALVPLRHSRLLLVRRQQGCEVPCAARRQTPEEAHCPRPRNATAAPAGTEWPGLTQWDGAGIGSDYGEPGGSRRSTPTRISSSESELEATERCLGEWRRLSRMHRTRDLDKPGRTGRGPDGILALAGGKAGSRICWLRLPEFFSYHFCQNSQSLSEKTDSDSNYLWVPSVPHGGWIKVTFQLFPL